MALNKQKGNMYGWVSHTWNPIRGRCPHQCSYCYMKKYPVGELRLDRKALNDDLSKAKTIFVGSSTDMWAKNVPRDWICEVLYHCEQFPETTCLFQSKNPGRFATFDFGHLPNVIFGTTIESNRFYAVSQATQPWNRKEAMRKLGGRKMVSLEPIMDFDLAEFIDWIREIRPEFISIGADSKGHKLPEPEGEKIEALIEALGKFTIIKGKINLNRILPMQSCGHPKSAIRGNGITHWCHLCEKEGAKNGKK